MKKELMTLSALSMLFIESCSHQSQRLPSSELNKQGELLFVDLPDQDDTRAYYYIDTNKDKQTTEYVGMKYVDERIDSKKGQQFQTKMPISKWRKQMIELHWFPTVERVKE